MEKGGGWRCDLSGWLEPSYEVFVYSLVFISSYRQLDGVLNCMSYHEKLRSTFLGNMVGKQGCKRMGELLFISYHR